LGLCVNLYDITPTNTGAAEKAIPVTGRGCT
jgi:hypothetical protein